MVIARILLVGAGGFVGATARYLLGGAVQRLGAAGGLPWGTFAVNALGCLAIGIFFGLTEARDIGLSTRLFVATGVLGGFTTFSTFSLETLALVRDGEPGRAALNVGATVAVCLAAVWLGHAVAATR